MACVKLPGGIHVCKGPPTRKEYLGKQISAKYCWICKRRRVHELIALVPVRISYYDPIIKWECPCEVTVDSECTIRR